MRVVTLKSLRHNFDEELDRVIDDQVETVVARNNGANVVIVPIDTWIDLKARLKATEYIGK